MLLRRIQKSDNESLAQLVRSVFVELKLPLTHTVYDDPDTDRLYEVFGNANADYFIAEEDGKLLGGCGYYPTNGLPNGYAELVKFYCSKEARGKGVGGTLLKKTIEAAKAAGYSHLYLESFPECGAAVGIYERYGFFHIPHQLGNSGHTATSIFMVKEL